MNAEPTTPSKAGLRHSQRQRLRDWSGNCQEPCSIIALWLAELATTRPSSPLRVATFHPLRGEPDLMPLLALDLAAVWLFPRVMDTQLTLHEVGSPDELTTGAFGIREPHPAAPQVDAREVDVFLCPGLAFSPSGVRLGRGKGFYDRLLTQADPAAVRIGVGLDVHWLESLPEEPHDIRMQRICCGRHSIRLDPSPPP